MAVTFTVWGVSHNFELAEADDLPVALRNLHHRVLEGFGNLAPDRHRQSRMVLMVLDAIEQKIDLDLGELVAADAPADASQN